MNSDKRTGSIRLLQRLVRPALVPLTEYLRVGPAEIDALPDILPHGAMNFTADALMVSDAFGVDARCIYSGEPWCSVAAPRSKPKRRKPTEQIDAVFKKLNASTRGTCAPSETRNRFNQLPSASTPKEVPGAAITWTG